MTHSQLKVIRCKLELEAHKFENSDKMSKFIKASNIISSFCLHSNKVHMSEEEVQTEDDTLVECMEIVDELDSYPEITSHKIKEIIIKSYGLNTSWVQDVLPSFTPTTNTTNEDSQLELEYTY